MKSGQHGEAAVGAGPAAFVPASRRVPGSGRGAAAQGTGHRHCCGVTPEAEPRARAAREPNRVRRGNKSWRQGDKQVGTVGAHPNCRWIPVRCRGWLSAGAAACCPLRQRHSSPQRRSQASAPRLGRPRGLTRIGCGEPTATRLRRKSPPNSSLDRARSTRSSWPRVRPSPMPSPPRHCQACWTRRSCCHRPTSYPTQRVTSSGAIESPESSLPEARNPFQTTSPTRSIA